MQPIRPEDVFTPKAARLLAAGVSGAVAELVVARCSEGRVVLRGERGEVLGLVVIALGSEHVRDVSRVLNTLSVP